MFIISISLVAIGIISGCVISKRRFNQNLHDLSNPDYCDIDTTVIDKEFDRIKELQSNILQVKNNIEHLDIPVPESMTHCDTAQSSLNKLSRFFEEHSLKSVGAEQVILSILPTSQISQSIHALSDALPPDIGEALFGGALQSIKDSIHSIPQNGLERFIDGIQHIGPTQLTAIAHHLSHHQYSSVLLTPIRAGFVETVGLNDATKEIACSLSDIGHDVSASLEASASIAELTDVSDLDFAGHIPVITIAVSSFREYQLLTSGKTDYSSSIKNIALDAAGAGVGGVARTKAGALAGGLFGPIGAVIGALFGAIGGSVMGRYATNKVKMIPLNKAIEAYKKEYAKMIEETDDHSKKTLSSIKSYADSKKTEFRNAELLNNVPVVDTSSIVVQVAVILYQFLLNEIFEMRKGIEKLKNSFWYSENKYVDVVNEYISQINDIESKLPSPEIIRNDPHAIVETITSIKLPNRKNNLSFQSKINECCNELKMLNDKNDSNVLVWTYMVNNLYQKVLNDIADYSNNKMRQLNNRFDYWKTKIDKLVKKVEEEKSKLGY